MMDIISETTLINNLEVGQEFNFPPNTSREHIRRHLLRLALFGRRFSISTIRLIEERGDKPARLTAITRTA